MIRTCCTIFLLLTAVTGAAVAQPILQDTVGMGGYRFFDAPIDPDRYLIRPNDQLRVTFIGAQLSPLTLTVNPEGRVVHPTLGIQDLAGATLSGARERLAEVLSELYNVETIDISVLAPRLVAIQVSGAVESPGLYLAYTSQRVSEVIDSAGGIRPSGSRRGIRLLGGPEEIRVDLDQAALGKEEWNPPLYAGNTVVVPAKFASVVSVVGQIERPREVEILAGETVDDVLALAGPLLGTADSAGIAIIRGSERLAGSGALEAGDILLIPSSRQAVTEAPVTVYGAVVRPGRYSLGPSAALPEVMALVGGFAGNAARNELTVFRQVPREASLRGGERYAIGNLVEGDTVVRPFVLQAGDSVFVPIVVGYVRVSGEVANPGMFPFERGRSAASYIVAAGGYLPRADREVVEVFHRVSRVTERSSTGVAIHDGDEVIVRLREEFR